MSVLLLTMGPQLGITADLPVVAVGGAGVIRFRPIGAIGPVKWTLVDSTLPAEWDSALNPDGDAVTLATSDAETPGTFSVTVRAVDSARIPVVRSFDVRVMSLPLTISGAFPNWQVGQPATGALTISGGVPPYSGLSITSGSLPSGVSLSIVGNQIVASGSPTVAGPWSATAQVSDAVSTPAFIALNGDVVAAPVYAQWDPTYLTAGGAVVNSGRDLVSTTSGAYRSTRSTIPLSGNVYFSLYGDIGAALNYGLGVVDSGEDLVPSDMWVGFGNSAGWWYEGRIYMGGGVIVDTGVAVSDMQIAARISTRRFWVRSAGGAWVGGGDPAADTSPTFTLPGTGDIFAAATLDVSAGFSGALARICAHPDDVTGTTPAGFVRGIFV